MKTTVLMPVFNEMLYVGQVLNKVLALDYIDEIIVVDDCSTDGTKEVLESFKEQSQKIRLICHQENRGKTAAINTALKFATGEVCVIQDADLEYDPLELIDVLTPIYKGQADVVYGSRFLVKKSCRVLYFYHYLANKALTFLSNLFTNLNMTDIETCYKAFRTSLLKDINLSSKGFGMEVEITALVGKLKPRVYEVPISYHGRTYEEGKKIGFADGVLALWYIFYYNIYHVNTRKISSLLDKRKT